MKQLQMKCWKDIPYKMSDFELHIFQTRLN